MGRAPSHMPWTVAALSAWQERFSRQVTDPPRFAVSIVPCRSGDGHRSQRQRKAYLRMSGGDSALDDLFRSGIIRYYSCDCMERRLLLTDWASVAAISYVRMPTIKCLTQAESSVWGATAVEFIRMNAFLLGSIQQILIKKVASVSSSICGHEKAGLSNE